MTSTYMFVPSAISMLCISGCAFLLTTVAEVSYLTHFQLHVPMFFCFFCSQKISTAVSEILTPAGTNSHAM